MSKTEINLDEQIKAKQKELEAKVKDLNQMTTLAQNLQNEAIGLAKVIEYLTSLKEETPEKK